MSTEIYEKKPSPPRGFLSMTDAPRDGRPIILAHRDSIEDFMGDLDFDVMIARFSTSAPYDAWVPLRLNPQDSGHCNHGSVVQPIGWLPLPGNQQPKPAARDGKAQEMRRNAVNDELDAARKVISEITYWYDRYDDDMPDDLRARCDPFILPEYKTSR